MTIETKAKTTLATEEVKLKGFWMVYRLPIIVAGVAFILGFILGRI